MATETYKFLQGFFPPLMDKIFVERNNNYSLRGNNVRTRRRVNSVRYGTETGFFLAPKKWDILSEKNGFHWNALTDFVKHMYRK